MSQPVSPLLASSPALATVQRIAWWVRALTLLAGVMIASLPLAIGLQPELLARAISAVPAARDLPVTPQLRWAVATALLPAVALTLFGLTQLWKLFDDYARGHVFTETAALRLRRLGIVAMLVGVVKPLTGAALSLVLSWHNPPGERALTLSLSSDDYVSLLAGAVLLAIASVMREATRLAQENAEFV